MTAATRTEPVWVIALGAAFALGLAAAAAWARHRVLAAYPEPVGVDGYWYAVQLRSLVEDGRTAYPSLPVALWVLAPFAAALGPVGGLKVGAAVGVSLHVLSAFALGRVLTRSTAAGLVAAAVVATSPASIFLATEFVKQGIALALLAGFLAALAAARERPGPTRVALAAASGVAAALAHKLAFALALAALAAVALAPPRRVNRRWLIALAGAAALFLAVTRAIWLGALGAHPDLALPALRFPSGVALHFGHETAAAAVVALALIALEVRARRRGRPGPLAGAAVAWTLVGLALVAALPWLAVDDPDGLGFRLRLTAHLALAPLTGLLIVHAARTRGAALAAAGAVSLALLIARPLAREEGVVRPNPALVAAVQRAAAPLPAGATIVTPDRQVAFLVTWVSRRPARTRPSGAATWRFLPAAWLDRESQAVLAGLAPGQARLVALPEATYRAMLARLSPAARWRWEQWDRTGSLPPPPRDKYDGFFQEERP